MAMLAWCCIWISGAEEDKGFASSGNSIIIRIQPYGSCHVSKGNHSGTWYQLVINSLEEEEKSQLVRVTGREMAASASVMSSIALKPSSTSPFLERAKGVPSLSRASTPLRVQASKIKKIKTDTPYGPGGGMKLRDGLDASGRKAKGKGVYQFVDKYGANVDGYSPIYDENDWSPSGDVYVGGTTGLLIWAVTLAGLLLGGALLVYNTSALAQ